MITSFFAPKSKSGSNKRQRKDEDATATTNSSNRTKKRGAVVSPPATSSVSANSSSSSSSSSSKSSLTLAKESATLRSFIHRRSTSSSSSSSSATGDTNEPSWRVALEKQFATAKFANLAKFIAKERASKTVYPPPELTFSTLNLTPLHKVKVVIVGQDPYHQPNQGHGLSFSVPPGIKIPPSLRNIYKELHNDDEVTEFSTIPTHGNLQRWAKQGVLLLNNVLTVRRGEAASHAKKGWEEFTDGVIGAVIERDAAAEELNTATVDDEDDDDDDGDVIEGEEEDKGTGVVFLLWGKPASLKAQTVLARYNTKKRSKHAVIMCSHPSPLGATKTKSPFMGSAMQDYGNLYFLMDLHQEHGDLWSQIRYQKCMVGCHSSLIRTYAYELLSALEHCHSHGIVHRDIKPENILLSECGGHVILIDFGTAKDLVATDLNGPEFVGTPDFMSPEAVKEFVKGGPGSDFTVDLWALGVLLYQLYAGALPFESQSPYLGFLKIQRSVYARNMGVWDDNAWDLIQKLLKVNPKERMGAGCFEWIPPPKSEEKDELENTNQAAKPKPPGKVIQHGKGYDIIRQHPFFAEHESALLKETNSHLNADSGDKTVPQPIPSLQDLAIRATAHFIDQSSLDVDLEDLHPPGDNSFYDALRLKPSDQKRVMHLLDRLHLLKEPRVFRRFFHSKQDARLGRVRPESRDVMGLTQMNDKMGQARGNNEDQPHPDEQLPASRLLGETKTTIHHITNPLFCKSINDKCSSETERKSHIKQLKESIRLVNRKRPTVVIACGYFDNTCRKLLSKVNETVPVILHDGSSFFNFWVYGAHCVAMPSRCFRGEVSEADASRDEAMAWFRMELEAIKTARSHGTVFVDGDVRDIPSAWIAKMGKSHVLGLLGLCNGPDDVKSGEDENAHDGAGDVDTKQKLVRFETEFSVAENEYVVEGLTRRAVDECDDDISTSSSDSDENSDAPSDEHVMHIVGRLENGVRCITVQEDDLVWDSEILL